MGGRIGASAGGGPDHFSAALNRLCLPQRFCQYRLEIPNFCRRMHTVETCRPSRLAISVSVAVPSNPSSPGVQRRHLDWKMGIFWRERCSFTEFRVRFHRRASSSSGLVPRSLIWAAVQGRDLAAAWKGAMCRATRWPHTVPGERRNRRASSWSLQPDLLHGPAAGPCRQRHSQVFPHRDNLTDRAVHTSGQNRIRGLAQLLPPAQRPRLALATSGTASFPHTRKWLYPNPCAHCEPKVIFVNVAARFSDR
jgi:hypothetical protein